VKRLIALALFVLACSEPTPPAPRSQEPAPEPAPEPEPAPAPALTIASVSVTVRRSDPGHAFMSYRADGTTQGGHLSGDDPPFVHQDDGTLDPAARAAMWAAAEAALAVPPSTMPPGPETVELTVARSDNSTVAWRWPFGTEPTEPAVRALYALAHQHRIGGW
jgi:hypothetical protein